MTGVATDILLARREAEAVMLDLVIIDRVSGTTWDETLGKNVPTYTVLYDSPTTPGAGAKAGIKDGKIVLTNGNGQLLEGLILSVPVTATSYRIGDRVRQISSALDPAAAGTHFAITGLAKGSRLTARRMTIQEVAGP